MGDADLKQVLEMSLAEISVALPRYARATAAWYYGHGVKLFLTNQIHELREHMGEHVSPSEMASPLRHLLQLRLGIREEAVTATLIAEVERLTEQPADPLAGEAAFVLAMAAEQRGDDPGAKAWWHRAYELLGHCGCLRKAAKAFHNVIATESRINPHKRLLAEYREVILLCEQTGERVARANAELNLSREFHLIGALNLALKYANAAVETTSEEQAGGLQYFLSLAQRCHVLIDLNLAKSAVADFEELQCALFPEARAAAEVLAKLLEQQLWIPSQTRGHGGPTKSWAERAKTADRAGGPAVVFSDLENQLIEALSTGPKDRHELIEALFGAGGDLLAKENRLKQLLFRIRRKAPDLIGVHARRYFIVEPAAAAQL